MSKVLLVDKDATRAQAIRAVLERGGYEIVVGRDGNEGLKLFLDNLPDLVMVGAMAADPENTFCSRLRETRPGRTTPLVFYAEALRGGALREALERTGCNVYVEMPASEERLIEVCRHTLIEAGQSAGAPDAPAFQSPDDAVHTLASEGPDIDEHLQSMFETGAPPVEPRHPHVPEPADEAPPLASDPEPEPHAIAAPAEEPPLEIDYPEAEPPIAEPPAASFIDREPAPEPVPVAAESAESVSEACDDGPDAPTAHGLPPVRPEEVGQPDGEVAAETTADEAMDFSVEVPTVPPPSAEPAPAHEPVVSFESPTAPDPGPVAEAEVPPVPAVAGSESTSRGWLWTLLAVVVLAGAGALFFTFGPSLTGSAPEPRRTTTSATSQPIHPPRSTDSTPIIPTAGSETTPSTADAGSADTAAPDAAEMQEVLDATLAADAMNPGPEIARVDPPSPGGEPSAASDPPSSQAPAGSPQPAQPANPRPTVDAQATTSAPETVKEPAPTMPGPAPARTAPRPDPAATETAETSAGTATQPQASPPAATVPQPDPPTPTTTDTEAGTTETGAGTPAGEPAFEPTMETVEVTSAAPGYTPPQAIRRPKPAYDPADVPAGGETVVLRVLVNDWGKVVRVVVEEGRGGSPRVDAAVDAVLNTRYEPAVKDGRQVRAWTMENFRFEPAP